VFLGLIKIAVPSLLGALWDCFANFGRDTSISTHLRAGGGGQADQPAPLLGTGRHWYFPSTRCSTTSTS